MEKFGKFVAGALLVAINLTLMMYTLSYLWLWFVVPLGVPVISWAQAYGLSLFAVFFQTRNKPSFKAELLNKLTVAQHVGKSIGFAIATLGFGYVASLFM